jgi:hypothetical protein
MMRLVLKSLLLLIYLELIMRFTPFKKLHSIVRRQQVLSRPKGRCSVEDVCHAVDLACAFYFKPVLCLQRSAAAAVLLRRHGWSAQMVIGLQVLPFKSHAWVELGGTVVNDKPYMPEIYRELERV